MMGESSRTTKQSPKSSAAPANQAYVEEVPDEYYPDTHRGVNPSPSTQTLRASESLAPEALRAPEAGIIDLTDDVLPERTRPTRRAAAATAAPVVSAVPASPSVAPANNISLMSGSIQGSPAEIPAKVLHKYGAQFRRQAKECASREGREDIITHERLVAVVRMLEGAKDFSSLVGIHERHGDDALDTAHSMLTKEYKLYTKMTKQIQEIPKRAQFRRNTLLPQYNRVTNIEAAMDFCDKLISEVVDLRQDIKKIKIET